MAHAPYMVQTPIPVGPGECDFGRLTALYYDAMPIPPEKQNQIGAILSNQGFRGCPSCGFAGKFLFGDVATLVTEAGADSISGVGVLPISCPHCSYVMLFDARVLPLEDS